MENYIVDIVFTRMKNDLVSGYTKVDIDLNKGASGKYIYLWYKKEFAGNGIVDLKVLVANSKVGTNGVVVPTGYELVSEQDLNEGAGGKYIYLCKKMGNEAEAKENGLTDIVVVEGKNAHAPAGYEKIDVDLNKGAGGAYLYLCYRRQFKDDYFQQYNGNIISSNTIDLFFVINGKAMYIVNPDSLYAVFKKGWEPFTQISQEIMSLFPKGEDIKNPALLNFDGKIYFVPQGDLESSKKYLIPNSEIFEVCKFDKTKIKLSNGQNYNDGENITYFNQNNKEFQKPENHCGKNIPFSKVFTWEKKPQDANDDITLSDIIRGLQYCVDSSKEIATFQHIADFNKFINEDDKPYYRTVKINDKGAAMDIPLLCMFDHESLGLDEMEVNLDIVVKNMALKAPAPIKNDDENDKDELPEYLTRTAFEVDLNSAKLENDHTRLEIKLKFKKSDAPPEAISRVIEKLNGQISVYDCTKK